MVLPPVDRRRRRGRARAARRPSYAHGYYDRDNAAYRAWDEISRDRETFTAWLRRIEKGESTKGDPDTERGEP